MEKGKGDRQLAWIYEGTKSLVNREDYLLGKRVDKNFELYSDAVIKEKESGIEALEKPQRCLSGASSSKISNLEVDVVRTEDPLVAIKMREERIWQEKMENPLVQLKMQKLMKKVMEKREKKRLKELKKLKKRRRERKHSADCDYSADHVEVKLEKRKRKHLQRDSHIPPYLRPKYSSSESDGNEDESKEADMKSRKERYGLVKTGKREREKREEVENPYKALPKKQVEVYKRPERRQLTEEEMEIKRREMLENADWRDEVRTKNIRRNALRDEEESRRNEGKTANFIRSSLNTFTDIKQRCINNRRAAIEESSKGIATLQRFYRTQVC
uniref:Pre-mRNA-splicing factor CWC25 homolog n=1 Tax=Elaeophora elaphi TaxID=1147741 RepID=A0A0R3RGP8_9BILA